MAIHELALPALGALALAYILNWLYTRHTLRKFAAQHGADLLPPTYICTDWPLGLRFISMLTKEHAGGYLLKNAHQRFEEYGDTWANQGMGQVVILTRDPENVKAILAKQFDDFDFGPDRYNSFFPLLGNGIFTLSQGKGWEHSRALLRPQFNRAQIVNDLDSQTFHVDRMVGFFPRDRAFDIQTFMFRLTLDTATEFLFGHSVNSMLEAPTGPGGVDAGSSAAAAFGKSFNRANYVLAKKVRFGGANGLIGGKEFKHDCRIVREYVAKFVDLGLDPANRAAAAEKREKGGKYVFLEALVDATQDRKAVTDQILNILLAGRDTTAGLLSMTMWLLSRNKWAWAKLREEVLAELGPTQRPDWEKLKGGMHYVRYVLNEALRLFPVVPVNGRVARRRTTIPRGGGPDGSRPLVIEKGHNVVYSPYSMQRRKDIYGADAELFRPERWEKLKTGWEYLPFNGGPRICLGQQYALMEASFVLVRIVQKFKDLFAVDPETGSEIDGWTGDGSTGSFKEGLTLTLMSLDGVHVRLVPDEE